MAKKRKLNAKQKRELKLKERARLTTLTEAQAKKAGIKIYSPSDLSRVYEKEMKNLKPEERKALQAARSRTTMTRQDELAYLQAVRKQNALSKQITDEIRRDKGRNYNPLHRRPEKVQETYLALVQKDKFGWVPTSDFNEAKKYGWPDPKKIASIENVRSRKSLERLMRSLTKYSTPEQYFRADIKAHRKALRNFLLNNFNRDDIKERLYDIEHYLPDEHVLNVFEDDEFPDLREIYEIDPGTEDYFDILESWDSIMENYLEYD